MQKTLPFPNTAPLPVLVSMNDLDRAYRDRCVAEDKDFPDYMLLDSRCQRIGVSKAYFCDMPRFEQNRELADEAFLLRLDEWQTARPTWIDWHKCNAAAKAVAAKFQAALCELVARQA